MKEIVAVIVAVLLGLGIFTFFGVERAEVGFTPAGPSSESNLYSVEHKILKVDGLDIFYREAGSPANPTIVLLHGFPTSSHMFRNLIVDLADEFHLIAPDYPGFGNSSMPSIDEYNYTFDQLSHTIERFIDLKGIDTFSLYIQDYGAPVGLRIAERNPERIEALIVQNGNAYEEGLREFWDPIRAYWADRSDENADVLRGFFGLETTIWQFTHGVQDLGKVSPDTWITTQFTLDSPGNHEIQLALFYDYQFNVPLYADWQAYFRTYQPPTLLTWGKNDVIFPAEGAYPYQRDLENLEFHLLDTGHFALEEEGDFIANTIRNFMNSEQIGRN